MTRSVRWGVFFDRDGTLNAHVRRDGRRSSPRSEQEWLLRPGARDALNRLHGAGATLAVVTNQPDLARGRLSRGALDGLHHRLAAGVPLAAFYVCGHTREQRCRCRKPSSDLLHRAAVHLGVDLGQSYLVGDRPTDAQAAMNAGLVAVLLSPVRGESQIPGLQYVPGLAAAAAAILRHRDSRIQDTTRIR